MSLLISLPPTAPPLCPARKSTAPAGGLFCTYTDGGFSGGGVVPFSAARMGFIYREIEGGSRRGRFEPVLVTHPTSTGRSVKQYRYLLSTSTGSFFFLYRVRRAIGEEGSCLPEGGIAASLWRDRGEVHGVSCFFVSLCAVYQIVPQRV